MFMLYARYCARHRGSEDGKTRTLTFNIISQNDFTINRHQVLLSHSFETKRIFRLFMGLYFLTIINGYIIYWLYQEGKHLETLSEEMSNKSITLDYSRQKMLSLCQCIILKHVAIADTLVKEDKSNFTSYHLS